MIFVKSIADLQRYKAAATWPVACLDYLESYYQTLHKAYGDGEPLETFVLGSECSLILLEQGDEGMVETLKSLPFGPEFVERIRCEGHFLWQITVMTDNDAFEIYNAVAGTLGDEFESWLTKHYLEANPFS